jgi:hypothetical protein
MINEMRHVDITFDLETCATTANAAVMQVAAVAWNRDAENDPFDFDNGLMVEDIIFNEHVDLRTCVVDGFDFDQETVSWWAGRSDAAKQAVTDGLGEPVREVFAGFLKWIEDMKNLAEADSVCLWCQGMDFDGSILRNVCRRYGLQLPFPFRQFRDCRTVILEAAVAAARHGLADTHKVTQESIRMPSPEEILADPSAAYKLFEINPLPERYAGRSEAHDALYDALRSSWNTWQALR